MKCLSICSSPSTRREGGKKGGGGAEVSGLQEAERSRAGSLGGEGQYKGC